MKTSIYVLVFGAIAVLIILAGLSTFLFNKNPATQNVSLSSLQNYGPAPDIQGISAWINSPPLHISDLRGKVVLVDFWTYSCINCIRSIPYLNAWENRYGNNGLVIIGVHTPEFAFEHNYSNVKSAVQTFGIRYAVAMDNNYSTWTAYGNRYWPADYIIDKSGNVRYAQFGEGNYNGTERVIQALLRDAGYNFTTNLSNVTSNTNFSQIKTPEIYLGYAEARFPIGNREGFSPNNVIAYSSPSPTQSGVAYLSGSWYNAPDSVTAVNNSRLFLVYSAKNVNVVASGNSSAVIIKLDGKNLTQTYLGSDDRLLNGVAVANINSSRLYNIVSAPSYGQHTLEIDAGRNFRLYTFTFG